MPKPLFNVSVTAVREIHDMPGTWTDDDYRQLLQQLEVDDIEDVSHADLLEMTFMALQDMDVEDAADAVLKYKLPNSVSQGARQNIVQDLLEDQRPWEEAADIYLHSSIFAAAVLLRKTFPKNFSKPDMMEVILQVTAARPEAKELLSAKPQPAFVARILADAMNENSILERLFDEQLVAHSFPEAAGIIWQAGFDEHVDGDHPSANLTIYSSRHWLNAMESISEFQSSAFNDTGHREHKHG